MTKELINQDQDINDDYAEARDNLKSLISAGNDSLEGLQSLANDMEHPRAYEVLGTMLKTLADMNGQLLDIQKKTKEIKQIDKPKNAPAGDQPLTQNNVFVGSTTDLQKALQSLNNNDVIDVTDDD